MDWIEVTVDTVSAGIETLTDTLERAGVQGIVIEDEQDFEAFLENNKQYWDYVDEELLEEKRGQSRVKFYTENGPEGEKLIAKAKAAAETLREGDFGSLRFSQRVVHDEDWENEYKKYYKPIEIGERLLILPTWEQEPEGNRRKVLRLDPGISFGTGSHPTTRLCLEFMEELMQGGETVLDLGSGSGILSIGAMLLGARSALGCDIDPLAADIAAENAAENGFSAPDCSYICGNILSDRALRDRFAGEKYNLVLANIVADVIIPLAGFVRDFMAPGARLICSGIIDDRAQEVEKALTDNGFEVLGRRRGEDWNAFLLK